MNERGSSSARHARAAVRDGDEIHSALAVDGPRESMGGLLARNVERFGDRAMLWERRGSDFEALSWRSFLADVARLAAHLEEVGVIPGDRVVAFSPNRRELLVTEFAVMGLGAIHVPVFAGYPMEQASALAGQARPAVLVLADAGQLARVRVPTSVREIVSFDPITTGELAAAGLGRSLGYTWLDEILAGAGSVAPDRFLARAVAVDPDAACLMLYTSGTTGLNKGVLLTHDNLLSQQRALAAAVWSVTAEDRFLSYLPWHHSFGGNFEKYAALHNGALLVLDDSYGRDFDRLLANWLTVRPTVYFSVPKVFQQLVGHAETHPADADGLFHPELRFVFTAAAPLPANLSAFFAARGIAVQEGWGLTETAPCCTVTDPAEPRTTPGMVGYPIPGVRLRLAADGEILVRGPNVMPGYFDSPEATARALPGDGWFHTGDLGEFVGAGLRLVTRKDRVFKLLNAEKVVPDRAREPAGGDEPVHSSRDRDRRGT